MQSLLLRLTVMNKMLSKGLKNGEVSVLATGSVNFMNSADAHFGFSKPIFYDYQGFLVNKTMNIHAATDLEGKKV